MSATSNSTSTDVGSCEIANSLALVVVAMVVVVEIVVVAIEEMANRLIVLVLTFFEDNF